MSRLQAIVVATFVLSTIAAGASPATAQTPPSLVGGGLTALPPASSPLDAFMLYPNFRGMLFYDAQALPDISIRVKVRPTTGNLGAVTRLYARVIDEQTGLDVVPAIDYAVTADFVATIPGSAIRAQTADYTPYLIEVAMVENGTTYTYPAYRVSWVPIARRAEMNIAFDEKNWLLIHGVRRFGLGVYDNGVNVSDTQTDPTFWHNLVWAPGGQRRMNGLAVNLYLNYWFGETSAPPMNALMDQLQTRRADGIPLKQPAGPMYLQTANCHGTTPAVGGPIAFDVDTVPGYVENPPPTGIGLHPGSGGYYVMDKCDATLRDDVQLQYEGGAGYVGLKHRDPDSITFGVQGEAGIQTPTGNPNIAGWRDFADVVSTNPYPLAGDEATMPNAMYPHHKVADWTALTRDEVQDARPFMSVLQFFKYTTAGRWPTRQEMRNHAYMSIVGGARGIWWFTLGTVSSSTGSTALAGLCSGWCAERTARMNDLRAVVLEVADLEAALLADDDGTVSVTNAMDGQPIDGIRTKVKRLPDGTTYVIASNHTANAYTARFAWSTLNAVLVYGEEMTCGAAPCARSITPDPGSFTDAFAPYQAHVYIIDGRAPTAAITAPAEGATVSGTIGVTAAVSSGTGYTYSFAVDGTVLQDGPAADFLWDTRTVPPGSHLLVLTVKAGGAIVARATRTVTVTATVNSAPVADTATLALDEDTTGPVTLSARDGEQCELGFSIVTPPQRGTLGAIANQTCVAGAPNTDRATLLYTPGTDFSGTDSFTYKASDGVSDSTAATVSITVRPLNDAPQAVGSSATTTEATPVTVTLTGTDVDNCELGFEIVSGPSVGTLGAISASTCVAGIPNRDTAMVTYTPNPGVTGADTFTVRVNDGLASAEATVSITVTTAPTARMYVAGLVFESRQRGSRHDERIRVTVREAANGTGVQPTDTALANATVTVEITNVQGVVVGRMTGVTNGEGLFRTDWLLALPNNTYTARVSALSHASSTWATTLGVQQQSHGVPH